MTRCRWLLSGLVVGVAASSATAQAPKLFTVSRDDNCLRVVNRTSGVTLDCIPLTLPGNVIQGANGLARRPVGGTLFGIVKINGTPNRQLVQINPSTGVCTLIADTGDRFAGIAFTQNELFGVTGDGANVPETLYRFSLPGGASAAIMGLGNGTDGEAIGADVDADELYHASGLGPPGPNKVFERINLATLDTTPIFVTGDPYGEAAALGYERPGFLLMSDTEGRLLRISTAGVVTQIAMLDHVAKGLAFMPFCETDVNNDGRVDVLDLLEVLGTWGPCPPPCATDLNHDNAVDVIDLLDILGAWGPCDTLDIVPPAQAN